MSAASYARIAGANARLQVAFIGVGGIAASQHIPVLESLGAVCPCFCDVDKARWGPAADRWPEARGYTDYRRMYDAHTHEIDAVMVGTPDHHHYPATIIAMTLGKHAYTQKPLTHTVWEARQLQIAHRRHKVATQMGNQGHASEEIRLTIDYLLGGAIGDLLEAHVWTDRPWWRQGLPRPGGEEPVPNTLDWESWIGPAPFVPYRHTPADRWGGLYHPFNWRGWWDFGTGALGDMACHEIDAVYWAMLPGQPDLVELVRGEPFHDAPMYNGPTTVRFRFPERGIKRGFDLYWHDGGNKPDRPPELPDGEELSAAGALYIGTRGKMICMPYPKAPPRLLPAEKHEAFGPAPQMVERSAEGHHGEWYLACTGQKPWDYPRSNFAYAGQLTETVLLGCIAQRIGGSLRYDPESMRFPDSPEATDLLNKWYRKGWHFPA